MLDDLHDAIDTDDGVMDDLRAPAVAVLGACEVNGIATLSLAHEDTIPHHNGIHTLQDMVFVSIRVHLCNPWEIISPCPLGRDLNYLNQGYPM